MVHSAKVISPVNNADAALLYLAIVYMSTRHRASYMTCNNDVMHLFILFSDAISITHCQGMFIYIPSTWTHVAAKGASHNVASENINGGLNECMITNVT